MIMAAPAIPKIGYFKTMRYLSLIVILSLSVCARPSCSDQSTGLKRFEYKQYHMGVDVRIVLYAATEGEAVRAASAAFIRFAQLDDIMSDYRASSELMKLCSKSGGPPVRISPDLFKALERSQQVAMQSDGAFDVTCGPIIQLWRKARKTLTPSLPSRSFDRLGDRATADLSPLTTPGAGRLRAIGRTSWGQVGGQ